MRKAFTLAEVLITLGIIGVVAALTMPNLISKYQKHVYYTQFRKAASVLENAINKYNYENACGERVTIGDYANGYETIYSNMCIGKSQYIWTDLSSYLGDKLGSMFNVAQWITYENFEEVCKKYDTITRETICGQAATSPGDILYENGYGFITNDGILIVPYSDPSNAGYIDINGPNKGPNEGGRDIFSFRLENQASERWGKFPNPDSEIYENSCPTAIGCGTKLLRDGKMDY